MSMPIRRPCPLEISMEICSQRWALQILNQLMTGPKRFSELSASLNGISKKTLSARLKHLVEIDLIDRKELAIAPPHVEYSLTDLGEQFRLVFDAMTFWGTSYVKYHMEVSKKLEEDISNYDFS